MIIIDFINNASAKMKDAINREILNAANGNSFYLANHSSIYPEMIKNTIFMFAASKLISEFHGVYRQDHPISDKQHVKGYQFGFGG